MRLAIALFISSISFAWAHDPGLSTAAVKVFPSHLAAEVTFARVDIEAVAPLDTNHDGEIGAEEWEHTQPFLESLLSDALNIRVNGDTIVLTEPAFRLDENDNFHIAGIVRAQGPKLTIESPLIKLLPRGHRMFISVRDDQGATLAEALLTAGHDTVDVDTGIPEARPAGTATMFGQFLFMGVEHILTGYDHLIFLFALLLATSQFRATLWVITCFTLAHSVTLALAAFDLVRVPNRIVEPLIAITIIYVGAENLLRLDNPTGRWKLTLIFGLVHGLGFATHLKEQVAGMIGGKIVFPLLSFNLGVELGQMAVAVLVLPLIWCLRAEPALLRRVIPSCSALVVLAGAWWLWQRTLLG